MAIAHLESRTGVGSLTDTPDLTNVTSPAAGTLLIGGVVTNSTHTVSSPPSGWTAIVENLAAGGSDSGMSVYYKIAGASEPATYTDFLTFAESELVLPFITAWTGVDQTTPLDVAAQSEGSTSSTDKDTPSITPTTSGAVLVAFIGADPAGALSFVWDGGIDERVDDDGGGSGEVFVTIGSKTWGGSGAETLGGDLSASDNATELIVALRPASGGSIVTGSVVFPTTFGAVTTGVRETFAAIASPFTFGETVTGNRTTFGAVASPITFGAVTSGTTGNIITGAATQTFTFGATTAGKRNRKGAVASPITFGATVSGQHTATGAVASPITFGATTSGAVLITAAVSQAFTFGAVTAGSNATTGRVSLPVTFGAFTLPVGVILFLSGISDDSATLDAVVCDSATLAAITDDSATLSTPT